MFFKHNNLFHTFLLLALTVLVTAAISGCGNKPKEAEDEKLKNESSNISASSEVNDVADEDIFDDFSEEKKDVSSNLVDKNVSTSDSADIYSSSVGSTVQSNATTPSEDGSEASSEIPAQSQDSVGRETGWTPYY